jgi:soluble lytic murein transglycosylase-like protein
MSRQASRASPDRARSVRGLRPAPRLLTLGIPVVLSTAVAFSARLTWRALQPALGPYSNSPSAARPTTVQRQPDPIGAAGAFDPIPLSSLFTPEVLRWSDHLLTWAQAAGLDPNLAAIVMQIESCGDPLARSTAGASGLFQVMPFHFHVGEDPFNPQTNAARGLAYLAGALRRAQGDVDRALAGYNGGHSLISRPVTSWPAETLRYVYWGTGIWDDHTQGRNSSPRLSEWLQAGGARLCQQASQRQAEMALAALP